MPVYKHNGEVYNIPDDKSADFEKSFPDATVSYVNGKDRYDIPISKRDGFMAAFPSATLYSEGAETQQGAGLEEDVRTSFDDEPNLDAITDPKARRRAEKEQKRAEKEDRKAQESAQKAVSDVRNAYSSMSPQERSKAFREQARLRDEKYAQQAQMTPEGAVAAENELAEQTRARVQRTQDRIYAQSAQAEKPVASPEAIGAPYTQEEVDAAVAEYEALAPGLKDFNTNLAAFNEKYADLENTVKEINEGKRQLTREEYDALAPLYAEYEKESNALSEFSKRYDALLKTGPGREYKEISEKMDSLSKGSKTPENAWEYAQEYAKLQRNPIYRASIGGEGPSEDEIQAGLLQGKIEYLEQKLKAVGGGEKMSLSDINASLLPGGHAEKDKVTKDELKKAFTEAKEALYANPWYRKHLDAKQKENELASVEIRRLREARAQEINAQYPGLDMDNRYSMQKTDSEINLLDAAARMRESAIREYKTPTKYDDSRLLKNVGSGVAGWAEGMANDPFGIEGFWEDVTVVRPVLEKVEKIAGNLNQDEIISDGKMKDIEEQLTPGELAVLDAYFEKIGAHTAKGADTAIGYQIGSGIGDMIELGIEMAMTGGVGTAAKKATQKVTKDLLMKILGKRAYRKVARNGVGKVALWAMGKGASDLVETAVRIPFMPSTYRALGEGAVEVGSDYKLRDVTEYAPEKMWEQFVEQFTEVSNGFAFPLIGEVAKLPGMQKYISGVIGENGMRAMRAFIERGDIKLLDEMMIGSLGGEWEEEFMGAVIHSITDDPNALKDFFSAEQQLVLLGTLAPLPLTRGVAGGVGLAVPAAKADISWRKAEAELKSLGFDEGRIARIKEVMDNAPAPEGAREVIQALRDAGFDRRTAETSTFAASGDGVVNGTLTGIKGSAYDALAHYFWNAQQKRAAGLMAEVEQDRKIEAKRAELESRLGGVFTHEKHSGEGETREVVERCTMIGPDGNPVNIFLTSENFNDSGEKSYVTEDGSRRGFVGLNDLGPDYMRTDTVTDVDSYLAQLVMQDSQVQEAQNVIDKAVVENQSIRQMVENLPEIKLNGKTGTLTNLTEDGATFVPDDETEGNVVATWAELAEQNGIAVPEVTTPAEDAQVVAMAEAARYQQKQDIADGFTAAMQSNADLPPEVDTEEGHGVVTGIVSDTVDPEAGTAQFTVLLDDGRRSVTTAIPIESVLSQITPAPAPEVPVEAPAEEPVETVEEEPETKVEIPVDKKGNPIYDAPGVSVEDALDAMYDTTGLTEEQAIQYIDSVNKYIEKRAEEAEKGRAVKQGKMSLPELKQAIIEANRVADFWKAAKDAIAPMVRGMQRAEELRKKMKELGGVHPNDLVPRTMEEALAAGLAGFFNSGYRLNRKSVLDLIGHDKGNDLAKNGYSFVVSNKPGSIPVDKFVMDIADEYPDLIKDEQDAINMVEQLLRSKTRGELGNFILEARQKELADAAAAAEGTLNLDEMTVEKLTDGKFKVGDRVMFPVKIDGETVMAEATIAGVDPENEGNILVTDGESMGGVTTSVRATTVKAKEAEEAPEEAPEESPEQPEQPAEEPAEEPKEDEGEEEEEKVVLEDEEGTPGNFHWPSERVCTNPIIITLPGQDRKGAVNKVAIAEKDGKWYFSTYVRADAEKGSSWGNVIPTFRANYIAYGSREEALKKAADYIRFLVGERERKIEGNGIKESFNDAKALADQIDPPKGGPESPVKPEKTETKEEKAERKRQEKLVKRANKWKEKLGDVFTVLTSREDVEGIEDEKAKKDVLAALDRGERVGGFYRNGKAYIYLPGMYDDQGRGLTDQQVLDRTVMHEVITHKGLEGLLGKERFAKLCDDVWNNVMDEADQADYFDYVGDGFKTEEGRRRAAANEFMAHAAEESVLANELDKTKWQKFVDFVKKAIEDLFGKDFFGKDMSFFDQLLRESMNRFVLENGKDGALGRLSDRYVAANEEEALFSRRFAPTKAQEKGVVDDIVKALGISRAQAKRWVQTETSLAALVGDEVYAQYLDYEADDRYEAIKKDSDYPQGTVDFNNICRKRLAFTRMYQRLQKAFPNTIITGEDLATIRQIMKDHNLTVACGLCYVEDRRQLLGEIANGFIHDYQNGFKGYSERKGFLDKPNDKGNKESRKKVADELVGLIGEDKKDDLSIYDLITLTGSTKLSEEHPGIYAAFQRYNSARGQQAGNLFQGYAEYKREILKWSKAKVASVNANGGLRVFSYSDFEAHHLIDLVQIIQDCARMGVMIQGYTKVPAFARAVANTGIKLNRSLIPLGDTGIVDGKLAYDPVEGIDVNDKDFLESNDNIGNILIGINDEQIRLAMADPFVHYIIPYHSNQSGVLRKMKQTGAWTNYKNEQTEKGENVGKHGVNIYTDVLAAAEKEGKPIKNEKQFVGKFLAVCKEKGWTPRFARFLNTNEAGEYVYTPGYYKLLLDFKLFDEKGRILPQKPVKADFDDAFLKTILEDYVKDEQEKYEGDLDAVYDEIVEALGLEDREEDVTHFSKSKPIDPETEKLFDAAKKHFGTTRMLSEAGYALPDGTMLDFSGRHWASGDTSWLNGRRQVDHRDIHELNYEEDGNTPSGFKTDMPDFIRRGAVRLNGYAINLANKPTRQQEDIIRSVIYRANGDVDVDFGDGYNSDHYVSYERVSPSRVINDIRSYFDEGVKPEGNTMFSKNNANQAIFVSNAASALAKVKMDKATPEQWAKMLEKEGGLKAGEDKWLGLSDWLKSRDRKSLTKQEIADHIDENKIKIEETKYFEELSDDEGRLELVRRINDRLDELSNEFDDPEEIHKAMLSEFPGIDSDVDEGILKIEEDPMGGFYYSLGDAGRIESTRLKYTTGGLSNKREIALTVPNILPYNEGDMIHFGDAGNGRAIAWIRFGDTYLFDENRREEYVDADVEFTDYTEDLLDKYGLEWSDEEIQEMLGKATESEVAEYNRLKDKVDGLRDALNSKSKILVIDEIQSKRHQDARDNGEYIKPLAPEEVEELYDLNTEYAKMVAPMKEKYGVGIINPANWRGWPEVTEEDRDTMRKSEEVYQKMMTLQKRQKLQGVPEAPFEKNWHELSMKRMLRLAAEEGYDYVAWTTGDQQTERYRLSKVIKSITRADAMFVQGRGFELQMPGYGDAEIYVDEDGVIVDSTLPVGDGFGIGTKLSDLVGKEAAVKMMALEDGEKLEGESIDLDGGKGMRGFYDDILPRFMNKYGKKWGVKVEDITLPELEESARTMHAVPVTKEMKDSVMEGQTMFSRTPAVSVPENASAEEIEEGVTLFSKVTDKKIIDWFNKAPKTTGFRTVAKRDVDEYGSPMAGELAQVKGKAKVATSPFRRNEIEQAEENPDIADENGKVRLVKPKRKGRKKLGDVPSVDYNPYIHLRLDKINRQFKNAWERDDLIYIESEVPIEEVPDFRGEKNPDYSKSPYRAEKAALPVGIHDWNGGALMLSRYDRPIREVPWDEVADAWAADEEFKQNGVHFDIVPPQMRDLLTERGIKIIEPHKNMGKACNDAYEQWKNGQSEPTMFSRGADIRSDNFKKFFGDWENDPDNASKVVNEDGTPKIVYHGSRATADFDSFDYDADTDKSTGSGEKPAFFFTDESSATTYSKDVGLGTLYRGEGRIVPAYLSIKKPYVVDYEGANFRGVGLQAEFYSYLQKKWVPVRNTLNGKDLKYFATEGEIIRQYRETHRLGGRIELDKDYRFTKVDVKPQIAEVVDGIDRSEYDGAIIKNIWETGQAIDDYVAFDPKQIKHATENNGEYNPDDERMRFSKSTENLSNPFDRAKALTKLNGLSNNIGVGFEQDSKMRTKGGFDSKTGKVRINVDAHKGTPDLEATLLHEAVAHEGLDKLSSNSWRKDCSDIYGQLPESVKSAVDAIAETDRLSANVAMEKYIATLAEEGVTNNEEASVWQKVVDAVKNIIARLGFDPDYYTEQDFRAMLYGSYANQQRGGALETAERAETYNALRNGSELSHNESEDNGPDDGGPDGGIPFDETESEEEPTETDTESLSDNERDAVVDNEDATMFSRARRRAISATAADVYETRAANVWQNARAQLVDEFQPLIDFLRAVLNENAVDKKGRRNPYARTLEGLKDDERVVEMLRELPGKAMRENERYNEEFSRPMWNALGMFRKAVLKAGEQCSLDDMVRYVMLKSGIERNIQFAKRDAKRTHQKAYDARIAEINEQEKERQKKLDKDLKDGKISDVTHASKTAALQAEKKLKRDEAEAKRQANFANVDAGTDAVFLENRQKDYSGLMTWFQEDSGLKREDFPSTPAYNRAVAAARATYVSGVTDLASAETEAQNYVNRMEGLAGRQNADELWKRINAATKETLEFQYRHDMITRQQRDDIASTMKYYVPMRGFADETAEDLYSYYMTSNTSGFAPTVLAAKGRTTRSENPFGMIGFMHGSAVAQGMKNQAKLGLLNFVRRHPDNGIATVTRAWFVKNGQQDADGKDLYDVRYPDIPEGASFDDRQAIIDQFEQDMKQLREQGDAYNSHREVVMNNGVVAFEKESHKNEHIVKVYEGGKEYGVIFSGNPAAAQAVNGLTKRKADDYLAAYDGIRRGMSGMFTTYSPLFWITNFQRDTGQGFENAFIRNNIKYFGTYTKSWFRTILRVLPLAAGWEKMDAAALGKLDPKIADYYKEFVENGGPMGQTRISGNEYYERKMKRYIRRHQYEKANFFNACGAVLNTLGSVGEAIETLTRFTAFVASRESGRPLHQSISDAKEISTNFARRGRRSFTWDEIRRMEHMNGRKLNKVEAGAFQLASWMVGYFRHNTIFFNAAMQGIDNLRVNFANNPLKTSLVLGMYAALAFALKFWHSGDGDDEEKGQYGHTSDYLRRNNLLVPLGDGRYMKIALPQEYRWAYGFGDVMASAFMHDRPADELVDDFFTSFMEMLPVGVFADNVGLSHSLAPSIVTPWLEVKENKNFMGSRLYNEGFNGNAKDDPGWTKAIPSTGIGYVKLAEYLNRVTGGGENNDVFRGDIDINPAILEHIVEGYLSGPMQIVNGVSSAVRSVATGEEMKTRDKLFVNRLILDTHDNDKDAYYNDLYYYFKEFDKEAKRIDAKLKERVGEGSEQVDKFYASKMYRYMMVFKEYESEERSINKRKKGEDEEDIKAANDRSLEIHRDIATRCMEIYLEDED